MRTTSTTTATQVSRPAATEAKRTTVAQTADPNAVAYRAAIKRFMASDNTSMMGGWT